MDRTMVNGSTALVPLSFIEQRLPVLKLHCETHNVPKELYQCLCDLRWWLLCLGTWISDPVPEKED